MELHYRTKASRRHRSSYSASGLNDERPRGRGAIAAAQAAQKHLGAPLDDAKMIAAAQAARRPELDRGGAPDGKAPKLAHGFVWAPLFYRRKLAGKFSWTSLQLSTRNGAERASPLRQALDEADQVGVADALGGFDLGHLTREGAPAHAFGLADAGPMPPSDPSLRRSLKARLIARSLGLTRWER